MNENDNSIDWKQRLENLKLAFRQLSMAVDLGKTRSLTDLEKLGAIKAFEFTHELAWNVMKDYFFDQGNSTITGSKDAVKEAFKARLIVNGEIWLEMIKSRNLSSHTYNLSVSTKIYQKVINEFHQFIGDFIVVMDEKK